MLSYLQASPDGAAYYLRILIGTTTVFFVFLKVSLLVCTAAKKKWHVGAEAATGVDAAEKGDTKRLLLEKVPYDLQKRAILHKVSNQ